MPIYDISRTIHEKSPVWPGDQKFRLRWSMRLNRGDSCNVSSVTMSVHTGTHIDSPFHFSEAGTDVAGIPLESCLGPVRVIEVPGDFGAISAEFLRRQDWRGVERVLFKTPASELPEDRFPRDYFFLSEDGAEFLGRRSMRLVGTDAPSIDAFSSKTLPSHNILGRCGAVILEGLRLSGVPPGDYDLICLPLKFSGLDGSPVRAVLLAAAQAKSIDFHLTGRPGGSFRRPETNEIRKRAVEDDVGAFRRRKEIL
jgi:arylformamidase